MGFLDDAKQKLTEAATEHGDKIKQGLDKAGGALDRKTGGKYSDKIERGTKAAGRAVDNLGETDTAKPGPPRPGPAPDPKAPKSPATGTDPGGASEPGSRTDPNSPSS